MFFSENHTSKFFLWESSNLYYLIYAFVSTAFYNSSVSFSVFQHKNQTQEVKIIPTIVPNTQKKMKNKNGP